MDFVVLHDAFVGAGCEGHAEPQPAASVGAGAIWGHTYNEVTTRGGRYVQGGGCMTVGVAGLIQGGGFGSFSKAFGTAGANLLEAEIVTADGAVKTANACSNPDLFWALKGGGGGFGIVTRVTLRTHELPDAFGAVFATIRANSDNAYRRLVAKILEILPGGAFQPALGGADCFPAGPPRLDLDAFPGPRSATGGGSLESLLRRGVGRAAGLRRFGCAEGSRWPGAAFLGPFHAEKPSGRRHRG